MIKSRTGAGVGLGCIALVLSVLASTLYDFYDGPSGIAIACFVWALIIGLAAKDLALESMREDL